MKKKMQVTAILAVVVLTSGLNLLYSEKADVMSEMLMANVEALAYIPPTYTGLIYLEGELGTGGCINCPEPKDTNCTCK